MRKGFDTGDFSEININSKDIALSFLILGPSAKN